MKGRVETHRPTVQPTARLDLLCGTAGKGENLNRIEERNGHKKEEKTKCEILLLLFCWKIKGLKKKKRWGILKGVAQRGSKAHGWGRRTTVNLVKEDRGRKYGHIQGGREMLHGFSSTGVSSFVLHELTARKR